MERSGGGRQTEREGDYRNKRAGAAQDELCDLGSRGVLFTEADEVESTHVPSIASVELSIDTDSDADSALGIDVDRASSSASVASSVYRFVEEFGRTYHRYKEGSELYCSSLGV